MHIAQPEGLLGKFYQTKPKKPRRCYIFAKYSPYWQVQFGVGR